MIRIRKQQLAVLQAHCDERLLGEMQDYLHLKHARSLANHKGPSPHVLCRRALAVCREMDLNDTIVNVWVAVMMLEVGWSFYEQPTIRRNLANRDLAPQDRVRAVLSHATAQDWNDARLTAA